MKRESFLSYNRKLSLFVHGFSDENFLCDGFAQGTADADDDQRNAEKRKCDERIDGPEIEFRRREGQLQEHFDHDDECTREKGCTTENEEISSADIARQRNDRGYDERRPEYDGKREGDEPSAPVEIVDEPKVQRRRREIAGNEYDGIRTGKPQRQNDEDIGERETADGIQRPIQFVENGKLADDELNGEHEIKHRDQKEQSASVDTGVRSSVGGIIGSDRFLCKVGMIYGRSAKGTAFFGIGKLNTAFDAIHDELLSSVCFLFGKGIDGGAVAFNLRGDPQFAQNAVKIRFVFRLHAVSDEVEIQGVTVGDRGAIIRRGRLRTQHEIEARDIVLHDIGDACHAEIGEADGGFSFAHGEEY